MYGARKGKLRTILHAKQSSKAPLSQPRQRRSIARTGFAPDLQGPRVSVNPYTLSARINVADLQTLWEARASVLEQSQHAEPDRRQSVGLATGAAHKDCGAITLCFRALAPTT